MLKNKRDWREQIHLGVEAPPSLEAAQYWQLWGANQWPKSADDRFKQTMLSYFAAIDNLARHTLSSLAMALDKPDDFFTARMSVRPYLLMKAMSYLPQENSGSEHSSLQYGVTAHCDWSWLTFLIQDQVGGLEAQDTNGLWHAVEPIAGSIVVNTGELLEIESGGLFCASPHRVINARIDSQRYSVPIFVNPSLDAEIIPAGIFATNDGGQNAGNLPSGKDHVHKVIRPGTRLEPFIFGQSEYRRKAEGQWCYRSECLESV
jgi:isopenicillin N synthase-like dioxygenase